jgi:hypothetical protein
MKQFEGLFNNPFEITPDSPKQIAKAAPVLVTKTALVVDTNILLKQVLLRDLLKIDQETFETKYEVFTLDAVLAEVKDEKSREYIQHKLPYQLTTKSAATYLNS